MRVIRKIVYLLLLLLLFSHHAQAASIGFARITPETEAEHNISVSMKPIKNKPGKYAITFTGDYGYVLQAYLFVTTEKLSEKEQRHFEGYVLGKQNINQKILLKVVLLPKQLKMQLLPIPESLKKELIEAINYFELDEKIIEHSYIYIGFPMDVLDGGYRYSIDLGAYYNVLKKRHKLINENKHNSEKTP